MNSPLTPEKLAQQGKQLYEREEYSQAAELFEQAARSYQAAGDKLSAAEMANNRSVARLQSGDPQAALDAVGGSDQVFAAAGDVKRRAIALGNQAAALAELGKKESAQEIYWQSAGLLADAGEKDLRASVLQAISRLQMGEGQYMQALASMEAGLEEVPKLSLTQRLLKRLLQILAKLLNRKS